MEKLKLNIPKDGILVEGDIDKVMDFIAMLPSLTTHSIYKHFDDAKGADVNLSFCVDDIYCLIHKFSKKEDSGLIYVLSFSKEKMCWYIEQTFPEDMSEVIVKAIMEIEEDEQRNTKTGDGYYKRKDGLRQASKKEENKKN